jgi:hypothetical protein
VFDEEIRAWAEWRLEAKGITNPNNAEIYDEITEMHRLIRASRRRQK